LALKIINFFFFKVNHFLCISALF